MFTEVLKKEIEVITMVHLVAIVFSVVVLMVLFSKARRDKSLQLFLLMQISITMWMTFKIFKNLAPNLELRWTFNVLYYVGVILFELGFFGFTYTIYKKKPLNRKVKILLYTVAVLQFLFVITNPFHYKFYSVYTFWTDKFGPLFLVHSVIEYSIIAIGVYYGARHFSREFKSTSKIYKTMTAVAISFPVVVNILYISGIFNEFIYSHGIRIEFDITPISFILTISVFTYATFNYEYLDLTPIQKYEISDALDTSIIVLDEKLTVVYMNKKTFDMLGANAKDVFQSLVDDRIIAVGSRKLRSLEVDNKYYMYSSKIINQFFDKKHIISLQDVTYFREVEKNILKEHESLSGINTALKSAIDELINESKADARNFVAKELHDIIGHSLVVSIKSLEVAKLYYESEMENDSIVESSIEDSIESLDCGIVSMNEIMSRKEVYNTDKVKKEIDEILSRLKNIPVNIHFSYRGECTKISNTLYTVIISVVKELLTNSIKHAEAEDILINISNDGECIDMVFIDNGKGCDILSEGNGLKGIKERVSEVKGSVSFDCGVGEGFTAKIRLAG